MLRKLMVMVSIGLLMVLAACTGVAPGQNPRSEIVQIQVDQVEVSLAKSLPPQVSIRVTGVVGDSCNTLDKVTQTRQQNQIEVKITAVHKLGVPCMELAQLYDQTFRLEGEFPPGTYTVTVNGVVKTFVV